jgi:drug/metabolite transporter (DMT)-like permease
MLKKNARVSASAIAKEVGLAVSSVTERIRRLENTGVILQYTAPVWIMVFVYLFFGKKPSRTGIISLLIVFAGILCFFFEGLSTGKWLGDAIALLSGMFYAGVFMLNSFEKGDALSSVFFGQLLCGIFLSPLVLKETDFSAPVLLSVFFLGAVQVGLAYIFFTTGTKYIDPLTASIINALEPILNPVLVAVFYGEKLGTLSFIGAAIVLTGILYYNIREAMEQKRQTV